MASIHKHYVILFIISCSLFSFVIIPSYSQLVINSLCLEATKPVLTTLDRAQANQLALGETYFISATLSNVCPSRTQPFVLIVEVRDSDDVTERVGWQAGTVDNSKPASIELAWQPEHSDRYNVRAFAISGFDNPYPLSPILETAVTISDPGQGRDPNEESEPFSIILLPDTQNYWPDGNHEIAFNQSKWIVQNKDRLNIQLAIHLGDVVNTWNRATQWTRAQQMAKILDDDGVTYLVLAGNHDVGNPFSPDANRDFSSFQGFHGTSLISNQSLQSYPITDDRPNTYTNLTEGRSNFMVVVMEYCPPPDVLEKVSETIRQHADTPVILATHAFLKNDGTRTSVTGGGVCPRIPGTDLYSTEAIWDQVIFPNPNVFLVVSGHSIGEKHRVDNNIAGRPVMQLELDYQNDKAPGMLKIITFDPKQDEIFFETYSPWSDSSSANPNNKFSFAYPMN